MKNKSDASCYVGIERLLAANAQVCEKREPGDDLVQLLANLPETPPPPGGIDYENYQQIQQKINLLKQKMIEKHNQLMEALRAEELFSRDTLNKNSRV